jgi:trimethylamine monooxygenase
MSYVPRDSLPVRTFHPLRVANYLRDGSCIRETTSNHHQSFCVVLPNLINVHLLSSRNAKEFKGLTVLVVGASYSAEDIACQMVNIGGAKRVLISHRKPEPIGYAWPAGIEERCDIDRFDSKGVTFKDGSNEEVDAVILATGFINQFPFMQEDLRIKARNPNIWIEGLYKGIMWIQGGGNRLFYHGMHTPYTLPKLDVQALWTLKTILGEVNIPNSEEILLDATEWTKK